MSGTLPLCRIAVALSSLFTPPLKCLRREYGHPNAFSHSHPPENKLPPPSALPLHHYIAMAATKRPVPKRLIITPKRLVAEHISRPVYNRRKNRWVWTTPGSAASTTPDLADAFNALSLEHPKQSLNGCPQLLPALDDDFVAGLEAVFGSPSAAKTSESTGSSTVRAQAPGAASIEEIENQLKYMSLRSG